VSIHVCCLYIELSRSKLHKTGDLQGIDTLIANILVMFIFVYNITVLKRVKTCVMMLIDVTCRQSVLVDCELQVDSAMRTARTAETEIVGAKDQICVKHVSVTVDVLMT